MMHEAFRSMAWSVGWALVAFAAGGIAIAFLTSGLFLWVSANHGLIAACVCAGTLFLAVMAFAAVASMVSNRSSRNAATRETGPRLADWLKPSIVAAGLDLVRLIGGRRATPIVASALAIAWLTSRERKSR